MNKLFILLVFGLSVLFSGCSSNSGSRVVELDNQKTPNPKIETPRIKEFNNSLGVRFKQDSVKTNIPYLQAAKSVKAIGRY